MADKMRRAHKTPALLLAPAVLAFVLAIGGYAYHLGPLRHRRR
jgi:hypothetical protein